MKINSIVACEDIRRELDSRISAIGIYTDINLLTQKDEKLKFPLSLRLCFIIRIEKEVGDIVPNKYNINVYLNEAKISEVNSNILNFNSRFLNIMLINPFFQIPNSGKISVELILYKDKNIVFEDKKSDFLRIELNETAQNSQNSSAP